MGELVAHLYMGLAQVFAGLLPQSFIESARTGPLWPRILIGLFVGLCGAIVGLVVAALVLAVYFFAGAAILGIGRALLP